MTVLFLATHLNTGGITSYLLTLSKGLIRCGHNVHIVTSGGNMEASFSSIGVKVLNLNIGTKSELRPKIYKTLGRLCDYVRDHNIDIIHSHTRITQVMGVLLKRMTGKPFLSTCHGFFKTRLSRKFFPCWGDAVIAISNPVASHLMDDFNIPSQKVSLITNGIDIEEFGSISEETKKTLRKRFLAVIPRMIVIIIVFFIYFVFG